MSFERNYIKRYFPDYDYRRPREPWRLDYAQEANRMIVNFQVQAFVYWWAIHMCQEEAKTGLALDMDRVPYCISTNSQKGGGTVFVKPEGAHLIFNESAFPLVVASVPLFTMACPLKRENKLCDDQHVIATMLNWGKLIEPGGVLIATLPDASCVLKIGMNLERDIPNVTHAWSASRFAQRILAQLKHVFAVEEFDTLKNSFSFNIVLRKK